MEGIMSVQSNLIALNASRMLGLTTFVKAKSTEKLSSGYRVNRAADDAAGLAISEKMRRQIRGLTQASANCQEGVSLCQVADGALNETQDILQRMNELAVKAANGTMTAEDREYCQSEMAQLKTEIDRIATSTSFNEGVFPLLGKGDTDKKTETTTTATTEIKFELPVKTVSGTIRTHGNTSFYLAGDNTPHNSGYSVTLENTFVWEEPNSGQLTQTVFYYVDDDSDGTYEAMSFYDFRGLSPKTMYLTQYSISKDAHGIWDVEQGHPERYDGSPLLSDGATIKFVTVDDLQIDENGYAYLTPATVGGPSDRYYFYPDIGQYDCPNLISSKYATVFKTGYSPGYDDLSNLALNKCLTAEELPMTEETTVVIEEVRTWEDRFYIQAGAETGQHIDIDFVDARAKAIGVADCDVSTVAGAEASIDSVKSAVKTVSEYRSYFGAIQNRLEHTINNLNNVVENTTAAESQIRDTDMAKEMVKFSMMNILAQTGQSMLAQANQTNQGILSLL